jgi:hypothetical protein
MDDKKQNLQETVVDSLFKITNDYVKIAEKGVFYGLGIPGVVIIAAAFPCRMFWGFSSAEFVFSVSKIPSLQPDIQIP